MFEDQYDNFDDIPSAVRHLFIEKDGVFVLIPKGEMKTVQDIETLQESLRKERNDHKQTKDRLRDFGDTDPEELQAKLDRLEELEASHDGDSNTEEKVARMVEARVRSQVAPIQRKLDKATQELQERDTIITDYKDKDRKRVIHDNIRKAAKTAKLRDTAVEDAITLGERIFDVDESGNVVAKDGVGVTPGIEPETWFTEVQDSRPHWWPESKGLGARGGDGQGGGSNPWSKDNWNLTEQGRILRENRSKADQMAQSAGTTVGGPKPS